MKSNITELLFILDRCGSLAGLQADSVGGIYVMSEAVIMEGTKPR